MKPIWHAKNSARKYGGKPEDYIEIHQFMDSTKAALPDVRHRAILHSSFGCFIVERVFGYTMENSDGKTFCPRDVAEDHCIEDLGFIPSVDRWFETMSIESWMGGPVKKTKVIEYANTDAPGFVLGGSSGAPVLSEKQKDFLEKHHNKESFAKGLVEFQRELLKQNNNDPKDINADEAESLGTDFLTERTPHDDDKR